MNNSLVLQILLVFTYLIIYHAQSVSLTSCIEYSGGVCIRCDIQTHLSADFCYRNILGCLQYLNGSTCVQCDTQYFALSGTSCSVRSGVTLSADITNSLHLYGGSSLSNPGDRYGQSSFKPVAYQTASIWPSFQSLNTYITKGQYAHYISRVSNPVYSVHYYITSDTYSFKLLYQGSGGGLFLCIADIPLSLTVSLRSLTPISASNMIDFCIDYNTEGSCLRCASSYHLETGRCYLNFGGCSKYLENICIECIDYFFLIQNRCVSDCLSVSDARSILYYGNSQSKSTLEVYYGLSISTFYSITISNTTSTNLTTATTNFTGASLSSSSSSTSQTSSSSLSSSSSSSSTSSSSSSSSSTFSSSSTIIQASSGSSSSTISSLSGLNSTSLLTQQNCVEYQNGVCSRCPAFYFLNFNNRCQQVDPYCLTYNQRDGACLTCYQGYRLEGTQCRIVI